MGRGRRLFNIIPFNPIRLDGKCSNHELLVASAAMMPGNVLKILPLRADFENLVMAQAFKLHAKVARGIKQ